jgi:putative copper export protein/mono/diheme cytochrome c family protein
MPPILPEGGVALAVARSVSVAATLSAFGASTFGVFVAPRALANCGADLAAAHWTRLWHLARFSACAAVLATLWWLALQTANMANTAGILATLAALPGVVTATAFGHLVLLSLFAFAVLLGVLIRRQSLFGWRAALGLSASATVLQAGHDHAPAMYPGLSLLLASDAVHLLAAGAWLGGLLPLWLIVHYAPPRIGAAAARWFSPLGKICVGTIGVTALFQAWRLIGGVAGLIGTPYGDLALIKLSLLIVLLGFAAANRYRLAPALLRNDAETARRTLQRSLALQTGFGLLIILAAAVLSSLPPAIHEQPFWPFTRRLSLVALEDPDLRQEVAYAVLMLAAGAGAATLGLIWRRIRRAALGLSVVLIALAVPHLHPLFVEAYPTSFYQSPTGFAAASIVQGAALFAANCTGCHGTQGAGDGPAAASLPIPPADLTAPHLWDHSDGELFWWLSHGMEAPDGGLAMPGFATTLSDDERWSLIDYIRAHNAGVAMRGAGLWPHPVPSPGFSANCTDGRRLDSADLRGRAIRLMVPGSNDPHPAPLDPLNGTLLDVSVSATPPRAGCVTNAPDLPRALAILTGDANESQAGNQFLIDPDGWLRARHRAGAPGGWENTEALLAEVRNICTHPIGPQGGTHVHHQ